MDARGGARRRPPASQVGGEDADALSEGARRRERGERPEEPAIERVAVDGDDVHRGWMLRERRRLRPDANLDGVPILKAEPDLFPGDLFELPADEFPWWVAHLRSRQEKLAAREALGRGVPHFLPLRQQVVRRRGRKLTSFLPLFPGYLFFRGDAERRLELVRTNLCVRILPVTDQEALHHDLSQIRRLQELGLPLVLHPQMQVGDPVVVTDGFFRGFLGWVTEERGREKLVVTVRFLQRFVAVEALRDDVDPAREEDVTRSVGPRPPSVAPRVA